MKKRRSVMVYNVLFPTWFLLYLLPSHLILLMLAGNFIIDSLVLLLAARWQKLDHKRVIWKKTILRIWLLGFALTFWARLPTWDFTLDWSRWKAPAFSAFPASTPCCFQGPPSQRCLA